MPQNMKFRVKFVVADRENRGLPRNHSQKPSIRKSFTLQHDIWTLNRPSPFNPHPPCHPGGYRRRKANSYQQCQHPRPCRRLPRVTRRQTQITRLNGRIKERGDCQGDACPSKVNPHPPCHPGGYRRRKANSYQLKQYITQHLALPGKSTLDD